MLSGELWVVGGNGSRGTVHVHHVPGTVPTVTLVPICGGVGGKIFERTRDDVVKTKRTKQSCILASPLTSKINREQMTLPRA